MKQLLTVLAAIVYLFTINAAAQNTKDGMKSTPAEFQKYDSYFKKSDDGLKGEKSYLVFASQQQFDKVFGYATTMGQNSFLPTDAFESKIVVAAVKRGNLRHYDDVNVTTKNGKLMIWYNAKDDAPGGATYKSPLILAVDKGKYKEVVFMENSKKVGSVKLKG